MKIIDTHVHLFDQMRGWGYKGGKTAIGNGYVEFDDGEIRKQFPEELGDISITGETFIEFMKQHDIEKAVLMQGPGYGYQNVYYSKLLEKYPEYFCPAAMVDPEILFVDKVTDNLINKKGFKVFKFEMSEIAGLTGAHSRLNVFRSKNLDVIFSKVEEIKGTIALDIGGPEESSYQIDRVKELAQSHPNVKIVMCHLLEPDRGDYDRLRINLDKLSIDNIWFDISSLPTILNDLPPYKEVLQVIKIGKEIAGSDRLMWGTDFPSCLVKQDYDTMLRIMVSENPVFSKKDIRNIVYDNALRVYPFER